LVLVNSKLSYIYINELKIYQHFHVKSDCDDLALSIFKFIASVNTATVAFSALV